MTEIEIKKARLREILSEAALLSVEISRVQQAGPTFDTDVPVTPDLQTARPSPEVQQALTSLGVAEGELSTATGAVALIRAAAGLFGIEL